MAELRVPRYLITQKGYTGGWRPAKKPKLPVVYKSTFTPVSGMFSPKLELPDLEKFDAWEYRFWAAEAPAEGGEPISECRCCKSIFASVKNRRAHGGPTGCFHKLTKA